MTDYSFKFKHDEGKVRYGLIPPRSLKLIAETLTFGAHKYTVESWKVVEVERFVDAAFRHIEAVRMGAVYDKESGLPHLAHALTNIIFMLENQLNEEESK